MVCSGACLPGLLWGSSTLRCTLVHTRGAWVPADPESGAQSDAVNSRLGCAPGPRIGQRQARGGPAAGPQARPQPDSAQGWELQLQNTAPRCAEAGLPLGPRGSPAAGSASGVSRPGAAQAQDGQQRRTPVLHLQGDARQARRACHAALRAQLMPALHQRGQARQAGGAPPAAAATAVGAAAAGSQAARGRSARSAGPASPPARWPSTRICATWSSWPQRCARCPCPPRTTGRP